MAVAQKKTDIVMGPTGKILVIFRATNAPSTKVGVTTEKTIF